MLNMLTLNKCLVHRLIDAGTWKLKLVPLKHWTSDVRAEPRSSELTCNIPATTENKRKNTKDTFVRLQRFTKLDPG